MPTFNGPGDLSSHGKRHPIEMGETEVVAFLDQLAMERDIAASTQNQALAALLFLYKLVLGRPLQWLDQSRVRARKPERLPVVLTRDEVHASLAQLEGTHRLVVALLYGSRLPLMEGLRLRVKDVDFGQNHIIVRDRKGQKDRATVLPGSQSDGLCAQVEVVKAIHRRDVKDGFGEVHLPFALAEKYRNANRELGWQYLFPAPKQAIDPRAGAIRRHLSGMHTSCMCSDATSGIERNAHQTRLVEQSQ